MVSNKRLMLEIAVAVLVVAAFSYMIGLLGTLTVIAVIAVTGLIINHLLNTYRQNRYMTDHSDDPDFQWDDEDEDDGDGESTGDNPSGGSDGASSSSTSKSKFFKRIHILFPNPYQKLLLVLLLGLVITAGWWTIQEIRNFQMFSLFSSKKPVVITESVYSGARPIAKLYTGTAVVMLDDIKFKDPLFGDRYIVGVCEKKYIVEFGYDDVDEFLSGKVLQTACQGEVDKLPQPRLLAVNAVMQNTIGNYTMSDPCNLWDRNSTARSLAILRELKQHKIMNIRTSKEKLKNFLAPACISLKVPEQPQAATAIPAENHDMNDDKNTQPEATTAGDSRDAKPKAISLKNGQKSKNERQPHAAGQK